MKNGTYKDVVFSPLLRMNEIMRYSGTKLQEPETLSHHVTDVMMMSYLITSKLRSLGDKVDYGDVLEKALLHDLDEIFTGDLPRNTKYADMKIKTALDDVAEEAVKRYADSYGLSRMYDKWKDAKSDNEGLIISLVDMLCVVRKASLEVEIYGNLYCLKIIKELSTHLKDLSNKVECSEFTGESKEFLISLVTDSIELVEELNEKYLDTSNKYNITENILEVSQDLN